MKRLAALVVLVFAATVIPAGASLTEGAKPSKTCSQALSAGDDAINAGLDLAATAKKLSTETDPSVAQIESTTIGVQTENVIIRQSTYQLLEKRCRAGK
jgi:hypothetical protein